MRRGRRWPPNWRRRLGRPAVDPELPRRRIFHDLSEADKAGFSRVVCIGDARTNHPADGTSRTFAPEQLEAIGQVQGAHQCLGPHVGDYGQR